MIELSQFSRLDSAFAQFFSASTAISKIEKDTLENLLIQLSATYYQGNTCLKLNVQQQKLLLNSNLTTTSKTNSILRPLHIDEHNHLYLRRYWDYEQRLITKLRTMQQNDSVISNLDDLLDTFFEKKTNFEMDWQREAAKCAVSQNFTIITGGPGTGKTTTVVKILALLQQINTEKPLHIALAAPTGKAAMRLQESITNSKTTLKYEQSIKDVLPETVTTIHRLLGAKPPSPYFRYNEKNLLPYDLIVIDEASMIDLAMMSKLVAAIKPSARLILLGDKEQLSSVESGTVLADLTEALPKNTIELQKTYRFKDEIKAFAQAINQKNASQAWKLTRNKDAVIEHLGDDFLVYLVEKHTEYFELIKTRANFSDIYAAFNKFQILCAHREGTNSVSDLNYRLEKALQSKKYINLSTTWYIGRPVMITQNNATLQLYNGDIGICLPDEHGEIKVFFPRQDGNSQGYSPARLPNCETVFAMTIHKSQGSEFEEICVCLPEYQQTILTKELLYTAITRAKERIKLVTTEAIFIATVQISITRVTGLVEQFKIAL
ncbi:MAG: exodeoxyribonuclease V subunit alpha [Methylococcales bacterium]|nr:exodeoxyribonuclease V subunit alpha [Methylococcales bacterium]MDD5753395.1 exodeoxyribonuclease V subunit alpha [Methylococcales bacterium]